MRPGMKERALGWSLTCFLGAVIWLTIFAVIALWP